MQKTCQETSPLVAKGLNTLIHTDLFLGSDFLTDGAIDVNTPF